MKKAAIVVGVYAVVVVIKVISTVALKKL